MKYLVLLLLFCVPTLATAQCQDAVSTKDMQDCMDTEWEKSDAELNRVYQESLKKLNKEQCALLKKAQRAWLTSRDAQCQADYKMFAGGTRSFLRPYRGGFTPPAVRFFLSMLVYCCAPTAPLMHGERQPKTASQFL
jgi:uncharacterized protein YecT (DUF1311 family)